MPKFLQMKKTLGGILIQFTFLATTGKPHPGRCQLASSDGTLLRRTDDGEDEDED